MKSNLVKYFLGLSATALAMGGMGSLSAAPAANVVHSTGTVVLDASGECVRTSQWRPEWVTHPQCAGYIAPVAAAPAPAPTPPPAPPAPEFTTTTLSATTLFEFDQATLRPEGREELRNLASQLTRSGATYTSVLVEGHTCSIGAAAYNQGLSERRAASAAEFLVSQGVRPEAIRTIGYGEERPAETNATREGREQNRRVEVTTDVRLPAR
jgi:OmpA-OmpF porin, OOP family